MSCEFKLGLAAIALRHANELHLTHNEELMAAKVLGHDAVYPVTCTKGIKTGQHFVTNPLNHLAYTFHAIIREKYPDEYALI